MTRPLFIGLTGGIGSGKTTVSGLFKSLGVPVIDADIIAHDVVRAGSQGLQQVAAQFGEELIGDDGELRRDYLRELVFDDPAARKKLESIIHPLVYNEIAAQRGKVRYPYCIISSPLLLESRSRFELDRVVIVDLPESMQIERAALRDRVHTDNISKIIASQVGREERLRSADEVITNDKDLSELETQVLALHNKFLAAASRQETESSSL